MERPSEGDVVFVAKERFEQGSLRRSKLVHSLGEAGLAPVIFLPIEPKLPLDVFDESFLARPESTLQHRRFETE